MQYASECCHTWGGGWPSANLRNLLGKLGVLHMRLNTQRRAITCLLHRVSMGSSTWSWVDGMGCAWKRPHNRAGAVCNWSLRFALPFVVTSSECRNSSLNKARGLSCFMADSSVLHLSVLALPACCSSSLSSFLLFGFTGTSNISLTSP